MISRNDRSAILGKWTTWLIFVVVLMTGCSEAPKVPGEVEFEEANKLIGVSSGITAFGDSPATRKAAEQFSKGLKTMQSALFSGGGGTSPATKDEFLTYVRRTDRAVVVLCHVPELHHYRDASVRESLAKLAWRNAQLVAADLPGVTPSHTLIVGLRGFLSYGPIWSGKISGAAVEKTDRGLDHTRLYPYFAPKAMSAPPSP